MALRVLLVSLVASMGFELPSGQDVESWAQGGSRWVNARLTDLSSLRGEAERAFGEPQPEPESDRIVETPSPTITEIPSLHDDLTFDAVVDGIAKNFVRDLASTEAPKPAERAVAAVEPSTESTEATKPVVAVAGPSNETPQIPCLDPDTEIVEIVAVVPESPETPPVATVEANPAGDKFSSAVRLTREAVNAWASLIQPSTDRAADHGQADHEQEDAF